MVTISMDIFVRKFQPDRYQLWKQGKDLYNIDHTKPTPETTPEVKAWLQKRKKTKRCSSFQHTRSRSKKLKTPEEKKPSTIVVGTEITATEAATDCFKVKDKPSQKVKPGDTGVPSGEEQVPSRTQIDQNLLDNKKILGHSPSSSQLDQVPEIKSEKEEKEVSDLAHICSEESEGALLSYPGCNQDVLKASNISRQTPEDGASEMESFEKEEISSVSTEEDEISDAESNKSGLEPGEISMIFEGEKNKTSKSWRHPLNKPPARSPMTLVKQQAISDEELPEVLLIEEEIQETESWAKPLVYLWQNRIPNFTAEKEYNAAVAKLEPYCAICTLLKPYYKADKPNEEIYAWSETKQKEICMSNEKTKPLIPEICFIYSEENTENYPSNGFIEEDGTSMLISCAKCCVQVHASMYHSFTFHFHFVAMVFLPMKFMVDGFVVDAEEEPGQLWAHVMCAIAIPEVRFGNVTERTPIDTSRIPLQRLKLKCIFCRQRIKKISGACIQCSYGRCPASFHVTCAHAAGVLMEPDDWPYVVYITCFRHKISQNVKTKPFEKAVSVGQTVIAKHRNTRYYSCRVIEVTSQVFYEVMFDDGSFSRDTFPEDIVSRDCLKLGPPAEGEVVQVKWPDGKLYGAKYLGTNVAYMYKVEFEDGSQIATKREELYTLDEELPKRSTASDMRFEDTFYGADIIQGQKKRQRVLSSRFKNEYVDDPGCLSFLKASFQKKCQKGL
ncbi:Lysine-specific demethylase 4C [Ophiophagus hannah]|uniref:[histone H3]-trimethyl-L-lysine(9) demethylase n=1 Tax=Ophiophagus hannah TaxID=8665 RepID=V8NV05_OPHHA|nr:Lysine-specific demethylase 4C [Ophiophagus hannah]